MSDERITTAIEPRAGFGPEAASEPRVASQPAAASEPGVASTSPLRSELQAGRVGRAHGLDGSFYVTRPRPRLLQPGTNVTIDGRPRKIVRRAGTDQRPIVRLADICDRHGAEALRGLAVNVAVEDAPALGEGEWWIHELEGCVVCDGDRHVGTVLRVIELPSCEALEVQAQPATAPALTGESSGTADSLLVPMVKDAIRNVDLAAGTIDVDMAFLEG